MSVEISYKKQGLMIIFGLLIVFVIVEIAANVWWQNMIHCELEENEIFQNMNEEDRRQICVDLYNLRIFEREIVPNQHYDTININSEGFRGKEISIISNRKKISGIMIDINKNGELILDVAGHMEVVNSGEILV